MSHSLPVFLERASIVLFAFCASAPRVNASDQGLPTPPTGSAIRHEAIGCLVEGQSPLIDAVIDPPESVVWARVYFKAAGGVYYYAEMTASEGKFLGKLPPPTAGASPVTYYIQMSTAGLGGSQTAEMKAQVVAEASDCPEGQRIAKAGSPERVALFLASSGEAFEPVVTAIGNFAYNHWIVNARLGVPQKASFMLGYVFRWRGDYRHDTGILVAIEPGAGGGKLSLGLARQELTKDVDEPYSVKLTVLRTWQPWRASDHSTYVGVEVTTPLRLPRETVINFGVLRRLGTRGGPWEWVITAGLGIGM